MYPQRVTSKCKGCEGKGLSILGRLENVLWLNSREAGGWTAVRMRGLDFFLTQ